MALVRHAAIALPCLDQCAAAQRSHLTNLALLLLLLCAEDDAEPWPGWVSSVSYSVLSPELSLAALQLLCLINAMPSLPRTRAEGSRVLPLFLLQRQACHPRTDGGDQGTGEQLL
jgi:hypothetical protein